MNRFGRAGKLLEYTVSSITGIGKTKTERDGHGLSGISLKGIYGEDSLKPVISSLDQVGRGRYLLEKKDHHDDLFQEFLYQGVDTFIRYYARPEQAEKVDGILELFDSGIDPELLAEAISKVWVPELEMNNNDILPRWRTKELKTNPSPIRPEQVALQLNALYTLPEEFSELADSLRENPGEKVADYDHPVPLFEKNEKHELVGCLKELNEELAFEKERGILPRDHRVPVLLSVSVTHSNLDGPAEHWLERLLREKHYPHLRVIVLTESKIDALKKLLLEDSSDEDLLEVFSVFGKYGRHFNALKYAQLLLERAAGIRAGFKLDTDEGIRSRDLYGATGKTWFETLCHPYWGGTAIDWRDRPVDLAVNEGEYVNSRDIEKLGFSKALRTPDVSVPNSWKGPNMFFQKGFAHGRATALYNTFQSVEEGISHTVVKGGGYGITNEGLRKAVPFTFSWVGRAEDQQFYFSGLSGGIRGIFHPDLRIAHYKSSVQGAEKKTEASRFIGDMYRLIIFHRLADILDVKSDIDPMPGVFAGELARAQACFATLLKVLELTARGNRQGAAYLLEEGIPELVDLERRIDTGEVDEGLRKERSMWKLFIQRADAVDPEHLRKILDL